MSETIAKYFKLCATIELIFQVFQSFYMMESEFSYVHYLLSKTGKHFEYRTWLIALNTGKLVMFYNLIFN